MKGRAFGVEERWEEVMEGYTASRAGWKTLEVSYEISASGKRLTRGGKG